MMQMLGPAPPQGMGEARVVGGDEASLRQFVAAYFGRSFGPAGGETVITIGQAPASGLLAAVPLPDRINVIGAVQRSGLHDELLFTVEEPVSELVPAFKAALAAGGWQETPTPSVQQRGFVVQTAETHGFCHAERGLVLQLALGAGARGSLSVHRQRNPCARPQQMAMDAYQALPALGLPPGVEVRDFQPGGGGGSEGSAHTSALMITSARLADLDAHYRQQLADQGWGLAHRHADEHLAVSTWQFNHDGDLWQGLLLLTSAPEDAVYIRLEVQALPR